MEWLTLFYILGSLLLMTIPIELMRLDRKSGWYRAPAYNKYARKFTTPTQAFIGRMIGDAGMYFIFLLAIKLLLHAIRG